MNERHLQFLASPEWAQMLETDLLPWVERFGDLGDDVVEIGPGPGLTTDLLRRRVPRLKVVEVHPGLAQTLKQRLAGTNVEVICGDGTSTGLPGGRFSTATSFSVLHHIPSSHDQDLLFAETEIEMDDLHVRFVARKSLD
jgi:protein-L-isoaspartate O-methyltransferase